MKGIVFWRTGWAVSSRLIVYGLCSPRVVRGSAGMGNKTTPRPTPIINKINHSKLIIGVLTVCVGDGL